MNAIKVKSGDSKRKVPLKEAVVLNTILTKKPARIKRFISATRPFFRLSDDFFEIVNPYLDVKKDGTALYSGLIVRTGYKKFIIIRVSGYTIDEKYMETLILNHLKEEGAHFKEVDIEEFVFPRILVGLFERVI